MGDHDDFPERLRGASLRVTKPRVALLGAIRSHPHADTESLIDAVRQELPDVAHQTVYDALHALTEAGVIRRIQPSRSVANNRER